MTTVPKIKVQQASKRYVQLMQQLGKEQTQALDQLLQTTEQHQIQAVKDHIAAL